VATLYFFRMWQQQQHWQLMGLHVSTIIKSPPEGSSLDTVDSSGSEFIAGGAPAVASGLPPAGHRASLYDLVIALLALAHGAASRCVDGTWEGTCCRSRNCVLRVSLSTLSRCTSLLSIDTISAEDRPISMVHMSLARITCSCTLRELWSPMFVGGTCVDNPSGTLLMALEWCFVVSVVRNITFTKLVEKTYVWTILALTHTAPYSRNYTEYATTPLPPIPHRQHNHET
jgi:hypothetical protein